MPEALSEPLAAQVETAPTRGWRSAAKSLLPRPLRRAMRAGHRQLVLRRAMQRFLADPATCARPGAALLRELVYGWGNGGFSAHDEYLAACVARAMDSRGPILECGSGLSTLLVAAIAQRKGLPHYALEHSPSWAARVRTSLRRYGLDTVVLGTRPLKDYGGFSWYDAAVDSLPRSIDLVICDGPPSSTRGGRYGLVPILRERLAPGCVILLDDAGREQELAVATRWKSELDAELQVCGSRKPYARLTLARGPAQA